MPRTGQRSEPDVEAWEGLRPLPRGRDSGRGLLQNIVLKRQEYLNPRASVWRMVMRSMVWNWSFAVYVQEGLRARWRGRESLSARGVRLRRLFERVGGTAIKIGQQLAVRVDFLPPEVCRELGALMDAVPPFPLSEALDIVQATLGRPVDEVFEHIDPKPIGSASIACVWKGVLRTGQEVAIKVRRPKVDGLFAADVRLIQILTLVFEALAMVRPGFFKNFRNEIKEMFITELDFTLEASYQTMFRRLTKRARLGWVSAPRVHMALSGPAVMVSDFVVGLSCNELLRMVETGDEPALARLREDDIDPNLVGQRVMDIGFWFRLESFFFHSDPHPGNILILPGGRMVMLDFGACGIVTARARTSELASIDRFLEGDISGAVRASLLTLSPLPPIDLARFQRAGIEVWWERYLDIQNKKSAWWERTSAALWLSLIDIARDFQLPVNADTLRAARASLLYDTLAYRLNPDIQYEDTFKSWQRRAARRARRRAERDAQRDEEILIPRQIARFDELRHTVDRGFLWLDRFVRDAPAEMDAAVGKASYFAAMMIRVSTHLLIFLAVATVGYLLYQQHLRAASRWTVDFRQLLGHPVVNVAIMVIAYHALKRIRTRMEDLE